MSDKRYRLNVDFDNTVVPFLYNGSGEYTFTVPATPNFMDTRYVVFIPCAMVLNDPTKIPAIAGYTRIEGAIPDSDEFRTIAAEDYGTLLLKDAIEFNATEAGTTLTITNLYTVGSTVSPDAGALYNEDRRGFAIYTSKSSGVNSDLSLGVLYRSEGILSVDGVECICESPSIVPVGSDLTNGYWHIIYCDNAGILSIEQTTDTDYTQFPQSQLDSLAPINTKKLARYKSGDSTKRAIALAYSLPTQSTYAAGTTYGRCAMVEYSGNVYVSLADSNTGNTPNSSPAYWLLMGNALRIFAPKIYNLPEDIFGNGQLGSVTLDGTGLGATATPFYGIKERTLEDVTGTYDVEHSEYNFENLTLSGVCYCGRSNGFSCDPVIIRVKGTLTIESGGQLNGDSRGANGGAGGSGGAGAGETYYTAGAAGGAGAKSGRPILVFANRIINKKTSGYWITTQAGNASNGAAQTGQTLGGNGGTGGGGAASTSALIIITNSRLDRKYINERLTGTGGIGGYSASYPRGGLGGVGAFSTQEHLRNRVLADAYTLNTLYDTLTTRRGGCELSSIPIPALTGGSSGSPTTAGTPGDNSVLGGGGGGGGYAFTASTATFIRAGNGGAGNRGGGGGGGCAYNEDTTGDSQEFISGHGGDGAVAIGGGGGGGGGGIGYLGSANKHYTAEDGGDGADPIVTHENLGEFMIIDNFQGRFGI
jgi:hypothetical protein